MLYLFNQLNLARCPHCNIDKPHIAVETNHTYQSKGHDGKNLRFWKVYFCKACGGGILAGSIEGDGKIVTEIYPTSKNVDENIPDPAKTYLNQALETIHAPAGSIMLSASAIDAMLKAKGYKEGSLNGRIDKAAKNHLITQEMAAWAHDIRLDANDLRHADECQPLPDQVQAQKCINFAFSLAEFLFILPSRVQRGREQATST